MQQHAGRCCVLRLVCSKWHCWPPTPPSRYGVLPLLSRHYHAASLRWPIGDGMGITQLFLPAGRLSTQVGIIGCNVCSSS